MPPASSGPAAPLDLAIADPSLEGPGGVPILGPESSVRRGQVRFPSGGRIRPCNCRSGLVAGQSGFWEVADMEQHPSRGPPLGGAAPYHGRTIYRAHGPRKPSPPQDHHQGDAAATPPLARQRARRSPHAVASSRTGERGRLRSARHRALDPCPKRVYSGATGSLRRCFPLRLPDALHTERAVFVFVDPGHWIRTALRFLSQSSAVRVDFP